MCNTLELNMHLQEVQDLLNAELARAIDWKPRYHAAAFDLPQLIVADRGLKIELKQWGLIPFWVKDRQEAERVRFNSFLARGETVDTKPTFREAFKNRRCLVMVTGFFEWQHRGREKIPYYIHPRETQVLTLAGIHERWTDKSTGEIFETVATVTTGANRFWGEIHNSQKRMPVILPKSDWSKWLDPGAGNEVLKPLLKPCPADLLDAHTVSKLVSRPKAEKNVPEIKERYAYDLLF